ncbi:MAG: hypothetical protein OQK73_03980 [Gammaproteobacteria bacterium]|nr:hypothetical protein [Gammaproteobacteria bacterium]
MDTIHYQYIFQLSENKEEIFDVILDAQTLDITNIEPSVHPDWTRLDNHQCPNCKLDPETTPYCPLATRLVNINSLFTGLLSHEEIHVTVITAERTISHTTTAQHAISSFMGLIIPCSGCPDTQFFKPMARFHLPLSTEQETIYRASSMYLLAQYFKYKEGLEPDLELDGLNKIYSTLHEINTYCAKRLRHASSNDSAVNAVVLLDMFAKTLPYVIEESLEELEYLFKILNRL